MTKALHKTAPKTHDTSQRGGDEFGLPTVEAAKLRLNGREGLFASASAEAQDAFLNYDGPVLAGPKTYRKPA